MDGPGGGVVRGGGGEGEGEGVGWMHILICRRTRGKKRRLSLSIGHDIATEEDEGEDAAHRYH